MVERLKVDERLKVVGIDNGVSKWLALFSMCLVIMADPITVLFFGFGY